MGMIFFLTFYFDTHFPLKKHVINFQLSFSRQLKIWTVCMFNLNLTPLVFQKKCLWYLDWKPWNSIAKLCYCLSVCLLLHVMSWADFHTKSLRWCLMGVVFLTFLYFSFPLWCSNYSSSLLFTCSSCFVSSAFVCLILPLHFIASPLCLCRMFFIKHN